MAQGLYCFTCFSSSVLLHQIPALPTPSGRRVSWSNGPSVYREADRLATTVESMNLFASALLLSALLYRCNILPV